MVYGKKYQYSSIISIPENYKIVSLPKKLNINGKEVQLYLNSKLQDEKILIVEAVFEYKKALYSAEDYNKLRYYTGQAIKYFNEKIVLERID